MKSHLLKESLLSNTDWAVRQPPYKSSRFVTACLRRERDSCSPERDATSSSTRTGFHFFQQNNNFGALPTTIPASVVVKQTEWRHRAQLYVC